MSDMTRYERELESIDPERAEKQRKSRELAWSNRRLISDRLHWPDGALAECERVEREHPDWSPWWEPASDRTGLPARYTARRHCHPGRPGVSGETGDELAAAIEAAPDESPIGHLEPLTRRDGQAHPR